jgi:hypothetical protein
MREESPWIRLRQGIRRDILRVIDRLASIRGQPWPPFPSRLKVILSFIGAGLSVFVVFYVSGVRFQFLTPHVGPLLGAVLGFASGWGLFEISEHRRRRRQQQTIREALKAELSNMERVLNLQCVIVTHRRQQGFYFPRLVGFLRLSQVILSRCERVRAGLCLTEVRPTCHLATDVGLPAAHRHGTQSLASVRWLLRSALGHGAFHLLPPAL